ncbi:MAG: transposase zinc-binding domain-containing protein [Planctomycetota bacterium]
MGEHEWRCDACGQTYVYFNSRGNRHCPACREAYRQQWAENIEQDLLPVPYHHLMLTLPRPLTRLVMAHGDALYSPLMQVGGRSILAVGERLLAAQLGALCVLHSRAFNRKARVRSADP